MNIYKFINGKSFHEESYVRAAVAAGTDVLHCTEGPAVIRSDRELQWWIDGKRFYYRWAFDEVIQEVKQMSPVMRLIDDRWWVREWKD